MSLTLLLNIPGVLAMVVLLFQNREDIIFWIESAYNDIKNYLVKQLGTFYNIDDAVFMPFIFFSNTTSFSYSMSANTLYTGNSQMSVSGTISAVNGADLVFSNSQYQLSLTQLASALNELRQVRQELCEYKVKFGTKLNELELLLKEKEQ